MRSHQDNNTYLGVSILPFNTHLQHLKHNPAELLKLIEARSTFHTFFTTAGVYTVGVT